MTEYPKRIRERDPSFVDLVRSLRCAVHSTPATLLFPCGGRVDPDHLDTVGSRGSDRFVVPLCRVHHSERQDLGKTFGIERFRQKYGVDLWEVNARLQALFSGGPGAFFGREKIDHLFGGEK